MKKYNVLLVEDDKVIAEIISGIVSDVGNYKVIKVYDAENALKVLKTTSVDVVLMDIFLGGVKDGIDVMNEINKFSKVPFIYITGNHDQATIAKAKKSNPVGFIIKPFKEVDVKVALDLVLHKSKDRRKTKVVVDPVLVAKLTKREKQILGHVLAGKSNKFIGSKYDVSDKTISTHRTNLMRKLKARNVTELIGIVAKYKKSN